MSTNNILKENIEDENFEDSRYLYAKENKDLYLNAFNKKKCHHSKRVFLLIDKDETETKLDNLVLHVSKCEVCREKLKYIRSFTAKINSLIPNPTIPRQVQIEFESQLELLIKEINIPSEPFHAKESTFWDSLKNKIFSKKSYQN